MRRITGVISLFLVFSVGIVSIASGQTREGSNPGIATYIEINGESVAPGDIIVLEGDTYRRSNKPYDFKIVGVHVQEPALAVNFREGSGRIAVLSDGVAAVRVSGESGPIRKGDSITTSSIPGVGMKAAERGYVLGVAVADFSGTTGDQEGTIPVSIGSTTINTATANRTASGNIRDIVSLSILATTENPVVVFKYLVAAMVIFSSLLFSFSLFGKAAANSIISIGRNPMASKFISLGILVNAVIVIAMIGGGVAIAYIIIRL